MFLTGGGSFKCMQNACRGREGVKKGQKTACALYVWPLIYLSKKVREYY